MVILSEILACLFHTIYRFLIAGLFFFVGRCFVTISYVILKIKIQGSRGA